MTKPGVVPFSEKFLNAEDPDGNQLWRLTCMKEDAVEYIKVLRKNGFPAQEFAYDQEAYLENQK